MRWSPESGHVPRGFLGATGELEEVELVLVVAEPGNPQPDERHSGIESALQAAHFFHSSRRDQFHQNVGYILNLCWPHLTFDEQLRKVWLTESVLCSAPVEGGRVRHPVEVACGEKYLRHQLDLFPHALVVALGQKAQRRLRAIGFKRFLAADSVAPPGCNRRGARLSWDAIPVELAKLRGHFLSTGVPETMGVRPSSAAPTERPAMARNPATRLNNLLAGPYQVIDSSRLQATEDSDPGKWSIWKNIWRCRSFEELAKACPQTALTRTNRRITWRSEVRWALRRGWIRKCEK